ncbi:MAG: DUF2628 domain-containing protein [Lactobacillaceae bacterium]|jgi:hypothetical protein|nr:DUF2628 domain-containing protein [Lactobacillaceae bacterium]
MYVTLRRGNEQKVVKSGFSWTTLFFGFFPALFRGDFTGALLIFLIEVVFALPTWGFGFTVVGLIFSFFYNKLYINKLLRNGWSYV